ncbi:cysteine hydrolase family protein [Rhodospirillum rubrum]|uniref:Isochorismatase hydrolase n=1 Tax=Rhodospirillum rubrum (strain ATCC 11170 / ATH 1.1.1 / DSM 467 / LMG 4362 / NCIMB 8255 / S1) TaxID=269796 RepID=Q2RTM4_RHORT|nr:cysteine hydrolase family protein [Rhodospirillum rubrum]ABC22521.1 Isochorismatase hydrolase [Rhodospirillum rubrum ATCC 11170]AEO48239.1 isochorismatase hydrolase [Rhodospirillum rubrum F11]MBK5954109.1 cysteine hydrolase [Rhodospirillum rubrum]QXG82150.1 cysteine hydrolase [Rhodospirillum rubrum]HAQ00521.1 cysteine hydrolase [Rhodospirillum rubrum]
MTTALLIIDVQCAILAGLAPPERQPVIDLALDDTVWRLQALGRKAHAGGVPVVLVQHDGAAGHRLAVGSPGWALRPEIAARGGDIVVRKRSCDAFFQTDLQDRLATLGIDHLVIGGCMTQFCVDTTVRRAVSLGYDVSLIADGHTTADQGDLGFAQIIAHHNTTLDGFDAGARSTRVLPAAALFL